jgi:hypothetical protein
MSSNQPTQINDITTLRTTLFDTLRALSNKDKPMDIDRAKAINDVAQTIINSAKVEVDALRVIGGIGSGFIPAFPPPKGRLEPESSMTKPGHIIHRMK